MSNKVLFWLAGSAAVIAGVLIGISTLRQSSFGAVEVNRVAAPGDDEEKKTDKNTSAKKKKAMDKDDEVEYNKLTPLEANVILRKGTEPAFRGEYTDLEETGTYVCRRCNAPLYESTSKFHSGCGWPSFDDEIKGSVKKQLEKDGTRRIEIVCNNCNGHLGHVFIGEGFTAKNTRHCVNSVSMKFFPKGEKLPEVIKKSKDKKAEGTAKDAANEAGEEKVAPVEAKADAKADAAKSDAKPAVK